MKDHRIVSKEEWLAARKQLLEREKELTRMRDRLSRERRELPWTVVEKEYVFEGPGGRETLAELFAGRGQLIVYHFMFDPAWEEGCKSCSFLADHYDRLDVHLNQRDVAMVTVSKAPLAKLEAFKERMGWECRGVSSHGNDFNRDFDVSFTPEEQEKGEVFYNYRRSPYFSSEGPGLSVFAKSEDGRVFHTYSSYARGLDVFIGTYHFLDIVPKGRDEDELPYGMAWVRHHDRY